MSTKSTSKYSTEEVLLKDALGNEITVGTLVVNSKHGFIQKSIVTHITRMGIYLSKPDPAKVYVNKDKFLQGYRAGANFDEYCKPENHASVAYYSKIKLIDRLLVLEYDTNIPINLRKFIKQ